MNPQDWMWSSFRHYLTGVNGTVEIESRWAAWRREHPNPSATSTLPKTGEVQGTHLFGNLSEKQWVGHAL